MRCSHLVSITIVRMTLRVPRWTADSPRLPLLVLLACRTVSFLSPLLLPWELRPSLAGPSKESTTHSWWIIYIKGISCGSTWRIFGNYQSTGLATPPSSGSTSLLTVCKILGSESFTGWLVEVQAGVSVQVGARGMFLCPTAFECKTFKWIWLQQEGFKCPHQLRVSPPLNLNSWNDKLPFADPHHLPKFWGIKLKATTKLTVLRATNKFDQVSYNHVQNYFLMSCTCILPVLKSRVAWPLYEAGVLWSWLTVQGLRSQCAVGICNLLCTVVWLDPEYNK